MAKNNHAYTVRYHMYQHEKEVHMVCVPAASKEEAYDKAVYEVLPEVPYSAWVSSVTYNNGNSRYFNTFEGKPY